MMNNSSKVSVFDFDGTLIQKESVPLILKTYKKMGLGCGTYLKVYGFLLRRLIAYKLPFSAYDKATFRVDAMRKMADLYRSLDEATKTAFIDAIYHALTPFINDHVAKAIKDDKALGYTTVLLSGSYQDVLMPFKQLGFDYITGSTLMKDTRVLPYHSIEILIDQKKVDVVKALKKQLNAKVIKAYADSYYDMKLLEFADERVAVNPDAVLKVYALKEKWTIID